MVNKLITLLSAAVLVGVFAFYMCSYQVRYTEIAVKKRWGSFNQENIVTEPGLYFKYPWPIESVVVNDKRLRILDDTYEETLTRDERNILITNFVCWQIGDPMLFHIASGTVNQAEGKLKGIVRTEKKTIVSRYALSDLINIDKTKFLFEEVEQAIEASVAKRAAEELGIKVVTSGIRKMAFPEGVSEAVYSRMKQDQESIASDYRSEGEAVALALRAEASEISSNVLAAAERLSGLIQAEAQEEVNKYYREFNENVELRLFLDQLDATKEVLKTRTTLILNQGIAPFGLIDFDEVRGSFISEQMSQKSQQEPKQPEAQTVETAANN